MIIIVAGVLMLTSACTSEPEKETLPDETLASASPNKTRLLQYLSDEYGKRIIAGQMDTSWTTNQVMDMIERVHADTGKYPALKGFDFIQLPIDQGREQIEEAIAWWNGKNNGQDLLPDKPEIHGIVAFCWHWKIGPKAEFYTEKTDFRIPWKDGKLDTTSADFKYIVDDLDKVAVQLQRFKNLDIPVLWRPLHEASGRWFWWGASGAEPYKALWAYIYDYLAVKKRLTNLIWVWNGQNAAWFPDNPSTVDLCGNDLYPAPRDFGSQKTQFEETQAMVPGLNLMVALSENGAIPDPDQCIGDNALWSWFMTWNDGYGSVQGQTHENNFWTGEYHNTQAHKEKVYHHNAVITLDKLPDLTVYPVDNQDTKELRKVPDTENEFTPENMTSLDALSYFREEKLFIGWNLGNALDAHRNGVSGETLWGNPRINQAIFDGIQRAGYNAVRIPITWMGHIGPGPDYHIDNAFLERVAEVVGYAHKANLNVIINLHHDGATSKDNAGKISDSGWLAINVARRSEEGMRQVSAELERVWAQIAAYFRNYGDYLMFESMNEIHDGNWGWGDEAEQGPQYEIVNQWNQLFVDTVRVSGSNNARRFLVIPGYCTAIRHTAADYFKLPQDSGNQANKLIVTFHYYDPYEFGIAGTRHAWGSREDNLRLFGG
jgi:hypothetical protein